MPGSGKDPSPEDPLDTAILALAQAVNELKQLVLENTGVRRQVKDHERRLTLIEERLGNSTPGCATADLSSRVRGSLFR